MTVRHLTSKDAKFFQYLDKPIFVGDVLDASSSPSMSVGYYRTQNVIVLGKISTEKRP